MSSQLLAEILIVAAIVAVALLAVVLLRLLRGEQAPAGNQPVRHPVPDDSDVAKTMKVSREGLKAPADQP